MDRSLGFDPYAGKRWIYPINMPVRNYQKTAVEKALFKNMMIVLPTGFGKTFIAAVVMYNFYLWYPEGKLIFVAPTRPLVAQQIEECKKISGIPASDCIEITGNIHSNKRCDVWKEKRVFFATPQVIENDLESKILPAEQVRCIVIDEAHRAQGQYSYVNIVTKLDLANRNGFRVLALSATPGSDIERVQQVMLNLLISDVMFRTEDSIDLAQYRNQKSSKAWLAQLEGNHKKLVDQFIKICDPTFKQLHRAGLTYSGQSVDKVARFTLIKAMERIRQHEVVIERGNSRGKLTFLCSAAVVMSQKFELLTQYGLRVFYMNTMRSLNEPRSALKTALASSIELDVMLESIRKMFGEDDIDPDANKPGKLEYALGHPKLPILRKLLMDHFEQSKGKIETRAIVFSKYRESVQDIVQTLKFYDPVLKPCAFVGQGKGMDSKHNTGMRQKEQIQAIKDFKAGTYNVLVATCVAEEGLDIGEVDLIVCYDTSSSPISNTQRRGRTGRKRTGNVHTLVTAGYEEKKMQKAGSSRRQVEAELFNKDTYMKVRYRDSPRMVPDHIQPQYFELHVTPVNDVEEEPKPKRKRQKKSPTASSSKKSKADLQDEKKSVEKAAKEDMDEVSWEDTECEFDKEKFDEKKADETLQSLPCEWSSDWDSD